MRILHIDTGRSLRGGQRQLLMLLGGLEERGHEQTLLARGPTLGQWDGVEVTAASLVRAAGKAELIHAHDARAHTLAAVLCPGKPLVVARRVAFGVRSSFLSRWKYSRAGRFIAVSHYVKGRLLEAAIPSSKIAVVYDGAALPREPLPPRSLAEPALVVAPAIDDPLKGGELLQACCEKAGVRLRLSSDLPADLKQADLFVYLTENEGLGSAILLAMAYGVPVVASRIGGIPEIVEHGVTGLLADNRLEDVSSQIRRLAHYRGLASACAQRAYQQVAERFSDAIMVRQTEDVYRAVLEGVKKSGTATSG